jgi:ribonuclease J
MKLMMHLVKPKFMVPIHGELRHLKQHAVLAEEAGILPENIHVIENGEIIEVDQDSMEVVDRIPGGYVFVDGSRVGEIGPSVMREREALARDGVVFVHLTLDGGGKLREEPEIITRGFVYKHDADELIRATQEKVEDTIRSSKGNYHDAVTQTVRTFLYDETKTRPVIFVSLSWF